MKQLYYVVQTLLHGRNANVIRITSLGLGMMMSILLFASFICSMEVWWQILWNDGWSISQLVSY